MATLAEVEVAIKANLKPLTLSAKQAERRIVALEKRLTEAGKKSEDAFKKTNRQVSLLSKGLGVAKNRAGQLGGALVGALTVGLFTRAVQEFATFEQGMRNVQAVSGATAKELDELSKAALKAAATTRFNPKQTTEALYSLASSGQAAEEQIASLPGVLNFAEAAQANLGQATEIVTSTLNVFGLEAGQTTRVVDVFTAAIGASALNANRIQTAMRNAGPAANALGQTFEGTTAALALLTSSFGNGEKAGTGLKSVLALMGAKAKKMGINVKSANGTLLPLTKILEKMEKRGITSAQAMDLFGQEAGPAMATLIDQGSAALIKLEEKIKSSGQAAKVAASQLDTLSGDFASLGSAISAALVSVGESQSNVLRDTTQTVTNLIKLWSGYADTIGDQKEATESLSAVIETIAALLAIRVTAGLLSSARAMGVLTLASASLSGKLSLAATSAVVLRGALAFIGGPIGLALLAVSGAAVVLSRDVTGASEATDVYNGIIQRAGDLSKTAGKGIEDAAFALAKVEVAATAAGRALQKEQGALALSVFSREMEARIASSQISFDKGTQGIVKNLKELGQKFFDGTITLKEYRDATDDVFKNNPNIKPLINALQEIAKNASVAKGFMRGLNAELSTADLYANYPMSPPKKKETKTGFTLPTSKKRDVFADAQKQIRQRQADLIAETGVLSALNPLQNDYGLALARVRVERELLNAAEQQGLEITEPLRAGIKQLADEYASAEAAAERLAESQDSIRQKADDFREGSKSFASSIISDLRSGTEQAKIFENALSRITDQLVEMALNATFSAGTGGTSNLISSLFGGFRAEGGPVASNKAYVVGEKGPEIFAPSSSGTIVPNKLLNPESNSAQQQTNIQMGGIEINAPGADPAKLEAVRQEVIALNRNMAQTIDNRVNTRQVRNTRP